MPSTKKNYWQQLIEGFPSTTKLWLEGFDVIYNEDPGHYLIEKFSLPHSLIHDLEKFSKKYHLSVPAILHGSCAFLLNRFSGADDIIYGLSEFKTNLSVNQILPMRSTLIET